MSVSIKIRIHNVKNILILDSVIGLDIYMACIYLEENNSGLRQHLALLNF